MYGTSLDKQLYSHASLSAGHQHGGFPPGPLAGPARRAPAHSTQAGKHGSEAQRQRPFVSSTAMSAGGASRHSSSPSWRFRWGSEGRGAVLGQKCRSCTDTAGPCAPERWDILHHVCGVSRVTGPKPEALSVAGAKTASALLRRRQPHGFAVVQYGISQTLRFRQSSHICETRPSDAVSIVHTPRL